MVSVNMRSAIQWYYITEQNSTEKRVQAFEIYIAVLYQAENKPFHGHHHKMGWVGWWRVGIFFSIVIKVPFGGPILPTW